MAKFDEQQIGYVGGESTTWPQMDDPNCPQPYRHAHRAVAAIRDVLRDSDVKLGAVEVNRDLAEYGRTRQLSEVGLSAIRRIDEAAPLNTARERINHELEALDRQMAAHAKVPASAAEIALASEIRSALRGMSPGERMRFIAANLTRPGMAGAVSGDAAYLAGLSESEAGEVRTKIATTLYAPQVAEKERLQLVLRQLTITANRAIGLVAPRSRVARNIHGEWATKPAHGPGPGPRVDPALLPPGSFIRAAR
ncbi:hypothetical protein ASG52_08380 [Methylobacterium sp. Leaf456]|uniref:hypothetical protein n=1 Tax=Methylobacterium sp. Leaf456 TaxID=1736382 RepID=UPI000700F2D0|nr:hypothetical protein [Methylobacterium sp. Leaf456]KQT50074.1 hypothetical protein ASG52_08380 [Methylobacterium sp. Leaf456]